MENDQDLTDFANHMMKQIKDGKKNQDPNGDYLVTDADYQNWKLEQE